MFIVSSLLLDDALKPATPLINGAISGVAYKIIVPFLGHPVFNPYKLFLPLSQIETNWSMQ